jgi:hypothetical protein
MKVADFSPDWIKNFLLFGETTDTNPLAKLAAHLAQDFN